MVGDPFAMAATEAFSHLRVCAGRRSDPSRAEAIFSALISYAEAGQQGERAGDPPRGAQANADDQEEEEDDLSTSSQKTIVSSSSSPSPPPSLPPAPQNPNLPGGAATDTCDGTRCIGDRETCPCAVVPIEAVISRLLLGRCAARIDTGDIDGALEDAERSGVPAAVAACLLCAGDTSGALRIARGAALSPPQSLGLSFEADAEALVALVLALLGNDSGSLRVAERGASRFPRHPLLQLALGNAAKRLGGEPPAFLGAYAAAIECDATGGAAKRLIGRGFSTARPMEVRRAVRLIGALSDVPAWATGRGRSRPPPPLPELPTSSGRRPGNQNSQSRSQSQSQSQQTKSEGRRAPTHHHHHHHHLHHQSRSSRNGGASHNHAPAIPCPLRLPASLLAFDPENIRRPYRQYWSEHERRGGVEAGTGIDDDGSLVSMSTGQVSSSQSSSPRTPRTAHSAPSRRVVGTHGDARGGSHSNGNSKGSGNNTTGNSKTTAATASEKGGGSGTRAPQRPFTTAGSVRPTGGALAGNTTAPPPLPPLPDAVKRRHVEKFGTAWVEEDGESPGDDATLLMVESFPSPRRNNHNNHSNNSTSAERSRDQQVRPGVSSDRQQDKGEPQRSQRSAPPIPHPTKGPITTTTTAATRQQRISTNAIPRGSAGPRPRATTGPKTQVTASQSKRAKSASTAIRDGVSDAAGDETTPRNSKSNGKTLDEPSDSPISSPRGVGQGTEAPMKDLPNPRRTKSAMESPLGRLIRRAPKRAEREIQKKRAERRGKARERKVALATQQGHSVIPGRLGSETTAKTERKAGVASGHGSSPQTQRPRPPPQRDGTSRRYVSLAPSVRFADDAGSPRGLPRPAPRFKRRLDRKKTDLAPRFPPIFLLG